MSKKNKQKPWKPAFGQLFGVASASEVTAKESAQVAQLIANGKFGFAVDIAKQVHKRCGNTASETLLMNAYVARISSLVERNLDADAQALMEVVLERYPSARFRLQEMAAWFAARAGNLSALVQPLNDAALSLEARAAISKLIRCNVGDLAALAECSALPPEHPLRTAASALLNAFKDVTSGPVDGAALALPEVSRHSPLAPWKLLVRAIAAFYRRDDQQCEKYLEAIEPDSAAGRLAPPMRALMGQKQTLTPAALALVNQAGGGVEAFRSMLEQLDTALDKNNQPRVQELICNAICDCQRHSPDLLVRLKQHTSVRAMAAGMKPERVLSAMNGPSLKNAYYWRLMARAAEEDRSTPASIPLACSLWEEFRKHAVHEGWFPAEGPEVATLYLHMADLLSRIEDDLEAMQERFPEHFQGHSQYYAGQPAAIADLAPKGRPDTYYLHHEALFERACQADPRSANFQRWLNWFKRNHPDAGDIVAARWRAALPGDIPPLLQLMESAEKTNALKRAFDLMEEAERINGLNPEVRKARLRLLISMATRHLKQKKPHLAQRELEQIEALPQALQGDRPAFVSALRWVWWTLRDAKQEAAAARAEVGRVLKSEVAASMVLVGVSRMCKLREHTPEIEFASQGQRVAEAVGRACALGDDMGAHIEIPQKISGILLKELSADAPIADPATLYALGDAAVDQTNLKLAFAVSSAGLTHSATGQARFLFLRARALPPWQEERCNACIAAASELARRDRDLDLLNKIGEFREEELDFFEYGRAREAAMSTQQIDNVIQEEKKQKEFPAWGPDSDDSYECNCPACRAARRASPDDFDDMPDFVRPPKELLDMVNEFGPEAVAKAIAEMIAAEFGSKPKRKKRGRTGARPLNLPF